VLRTWLRLLLALALLPALACVEAEDPRVVDHVLSRIGYGPDAASRDRVNAIGLRAYVEEQLHPQAIVDPELEGLLAGSATLGLDIPGLRAWDRDGHEPRALDELAEAKLLRAVFSRRQLEQVLADFWFDHFNVDADNGIARWSITHYEREAIRPHVLGRFRDMLLATARHPAMLDYLDNAYSRADRTEPDGTLVPGLNENYARELLELQTVGVDGGYTQHDVVEVARAFTGWGLEWSFETDGFRFHDWAHDWDAKSVMGGLQIPEGGGEQDGIAVIDFLSQHPMTAERVARLLVQRFVAEEPPPLLVMQAAQRFLDTGGDLREVMRVILLSPDFLSLQHARAKVKRPLQYVASLARAAGVPASTLRDQGVDDVAELGERLFRAKPPTGFEDLSAAWGGPGALLDRFDLAQDYAAHSSERGIVWGVGDASPALLVNVLAWKLLAGRMGDVSRDAAVAFVGALPADGDAAMRVDQAAGMVLAMPEFLLH